MELSKAPRVEDVIVKVHRYSDVVKRVAEGVVKYHKWGLDTASFKLFRAEVGDPALAGRVWKMVVACNVVYGPLAREFYWLGLRRVCDVEGVKEFIHAVETYSARLLDLLSKVVGRKLTLEDLMRDIVQPHTLEAKKTYNRLELLLLSIAMKMEYGESFPTPIELAVVLRRLCREEDEIVNFDRVVAEVGALAEQVVLSLSVLVYQGQIHISTYSVPKYRLPPRNAGFDSLYCYRALELL